MQFFQELGALIEKRWRDENYQEKLFPAIAAQALAEIDPEQYISPWEIIREVFKATEIPHQQDIPGNFGNPPITLYKGPRFHIDVYYWLDGTTSVHQHAFCGAFQVLSGSSIHSQYGFECTQTINEHFLVGEMFLERVELLEQGMIKQILPGKEYIHSLFHLDRPSVTLCVRTYHTSSGSPQYNYVKPYFAIDPFYTEQLTVKQAQSATLLLKMQHPEALEMIDDLLSRADFQTTFTILDLAHSHLSNKPLENAFGLTKGEEQFQRLFETARRRHREVVDLIPPVFEEVKRQNNLIHRRSQITSNEHRFFLALLLNVPNRDKMLEIVKHRYPDADPVEIVMNWMEELGNTKMWGSSEPNVLGIENLDDDYLFVFQNLLQGFSLEQTMLALEEESSREYAQEQQKKITELYNSITNAMLFKSIFSDVSALPIHHEAASAV
jgi:hypothetical protein